MSSNTTFTAYRKVDTTQSAEAIVSQILDGEDSVLAIPPRFEEANFALRQPPDSDKKYVGLFSSGSTGEPKCLWNPIQHLEENAKISVSAFGISENDRILILASPWHVAGLSWAAMAKQAGAVWNIETPYVKNAAQWISHIQNFEPTVLLTVPSVLRYLAAYDDWFVPRIGFGGASLEMEDYALLQNHCTSVIQAYGQTEAGGLIALKELLLSEINPVIAFNNVGKTPPGLRIRCQGTKEAPDSVFLESPTSITHDVYDTGDLGYIDEYGDVHLTGRKDDSSGNCNMITAVTSVAHK